MLQQRQIQTRLQQQKSKENQPVQKATCKTESKPVAALLRKRKALGDVSNQQPGETANQQGQKSAIVQKERKRKVLVDTSNKKAAEEKVQPEEKPAVTAVQRTTRTSLRIATSKHIETTKAADKKIVTRSQAKKEVKKVEETVVQEEQKVKKVRETVEPLENVEDLDAGDHDDPLMVSEYVKEIFDYLKELEVNFF